MGAPSWFAIGLHDAGTANAPSPLTPNRMTRADIVQVSASSGSLRDAVGTGYTLPVEKASPVATLLSAEVAGGRSKVSFARPFSSTEGVSLVDDGFVWLICAYKKASEDFNDKHPAIGANAVHSTRISLFGGVPESTRYFQASIVTQPPLAFNASLMVSSAPRSIDHLRGAICLILIAFMLRCSGSQC